MEEQNNLVDLMVHRRFQISRLKEGLQLNTLDFLFKWGYIFWAIVAKGDRKFLPSVELLCKHEFQTQG